VVDKAKEPWTPREWQKAPWRDKSPVMLLTGSAGGGKSSVASEKAHGFALHYPNATVVVSRKAEDDMKQSTIPLILETVIDIQKEPRCQYNARQNRVTYDNGSELIFTGIWDERAREGLRSIGKSGSVDLWWMEEAIEFEEEDYNAVNARMRGNAAPWTQIIVSTNPGPKLHWVNRLLRLSNDPRVVVYYSAAEDNDTNPDSYYHALNRMTGLERARLRDGLWIDGIGLVVDTWIDEVGNPESNVTKEAEYVPDGGPVYWFMDDGYAGEVDSTTGWFTAKSNPRVFLMCQKTSDGRLKVFAEDYKIMTLASSHIRSVVNNGLSTGWPMPTEAIYDGAAPSLGGELTKSGIRAIPIRVKIEEGLKELRSWVGADENGIRRLIVHPRCSMLRLEMGSYTYDKYGRPIDAYNHGIDALRYGVWSEAYGRRGDVDVSAFGVDGEALDKKIAEIYAQVEEKYKDAYP